MKKKLQQKRTFQSPKPDYLIQKPDFTSNSDANSYFLNIYEQIIENSNDIIHYCISYPEMDFIYISPSIKELTGKSREEFLSMTSDLVPDFVHPDDKKYFIEHYKTLKKEVVKTYSIIYRIKPPQGIYRWVKDTHTLIYDTKGNNIKIVGSLHDITDQKLLENAMKRSRERLFMAIEATNDGMWDWHLDTNEIYFDPRFYTMLGYDPNEFKGSFFEWEKRIHPDDVETVLNNLKTFIESKQNQWIIEYRFKTKNEDWIWILNRGKVFERDDNDNPLRMVGVHTDITKQKETEKALTLAKEKAQESDRLKSAFLANISHEIRTPMNGIIGFASLLKDRVLSEEKQNQFINIIIESSSTLLHVIEDIVDISKLEAGQIKLVLTKVNLNELFTNLLEHFTIEKELCGKDHIELKIDIENYKDEFLFETDIVRLKQVLSNLISNALKFTEKGSVTFGYRLLPPDQIELFVRDTGIGISESHKPNLFKHFRQHETTLTRNYGGIGLGLAICEGIVDLMGGTITLESTVGKGSEFKIQLTYKTTGHISSPDKEEIITNQVYNWPDKKILVVEDDLINQEYFNTILETTKARVIFKNTGEDAVEYCKNDKNIDLILMDIRLPYMNGYETFKIIKEINPSIPVIAQTAYAMTENPNRYKEMGFSGYLTKPINSKLLLFKIDYLLQNAKTKD